MCRSSLPLANDSEFAIVEWCRTEVLPERREVVRRWWLWMRLLAEKLAIAASAKRQTPILQCRRTTVEPAPRTAVLPALAVVPSGSCHHDFPDGKSVAGRVALRPWNVQRRLAAQQAIRLLRRPSMHPIPCDADAVGTSLAGTSCCRLP